MNPKREKEMRDRFEKVAPQRTQKVLDAIDFLWHCSNRSRYAYTDKEASTIIKAIRDRVDILEAAFEKKERPVKEKFTL